MEQGNKKATEVNKEIEEIDNKLQQFGYLTNNSEVILRNIVIKEKYF